MEMFSVPVLSTLVVAVAEMFSLPVLSAVVVAVVEMFSVPVLSTVVVAVAEIFLVSISIFDIRILLYSVTDFTVSKHTDDPAYHIPYFPWISRIFHKIPDSISLLEYLGKKRHCCISKIFVWLALRYCLCSINFLRNSLCDFFAFAMK